MRAGQGIAERARRANHSTTEAVGTINKRAQRRLFPQSHHMSRALKIERRKKCRIKYVIYSVLMLGN